MKRIQNGYPQRKNQVVQSVNKLGLTQDERAVTYTNAIGQTRVGEIRQFDPIDGHIVVYQGFDEPNSIEFLYDSDTEVWRGVGEFAGFILNVDQNLIEVPLTKTVDTDSSAKAVTVSRFPS